MTPLWVALLARLGRHGLDVETLGDDLVHRWQEPHRHYHTTTHLALMLQSLGVDAQPALALAIWFHDAVYDPRRTDNEEASAALARLSLTRLGLAPELTNEVVRLILLTKRHSTTAEDTTGQLLLDLDLMILGADEATYDRYAEAIRQEYAHVEEAAYRQGRAAVLRTFLQREHLFLTDRYHRTLELCARQNLQREIDHLLSS